MKFKFATRNFLGKPVRFYSVEEQELPTSAPTKSIIGHHILIVDCSGSMYGDIGDVKEKIRKMLTLDEYRDSEMLVSLYSYASKGDVIEHFTRVKVGDIVKSKNTKAQREIGSLKARGMTCMTQAFEAAYELAKKGDKDELTAVSLHTDGFFNDPSPSAEYRTIDALIEKWKGLKNVFVNTIGYRDWCDYKILGKISNALSGKCWQAKGIKEFYDSIYDTTSLLAGQTTPALYLEESGRYEYQVFVSSDGKVIGGKGDLTISGVKADAKRTVYRFHEVDQKTHDAIKDELPTQAALAFAKAQLAEGKVNAAKYAVVSTQFETMLRTHARALTNKDLAVFAADLDAAIFAPDLEKKYTRSKDYGLDVSEASVPKLLSLLAANRGDFLLDMKDLAEYYQRRGIKRVTGSWDDKGKLVKPDVRSELRDKDQFVSVSGFEFNRNNATINMMIARPAKLVLVKDGSEVKELGGMKLDLTDYKQYTIVGDGSVNVRSLKVRVTGKKLWKALIDVGAVSGALDPKAAVEIALWSRPLVEYDAKFDASLLKTLPERLAVLHTADKLFGALLKEKSADLTAEQIDELKKHYVSPNMYINMPTTTPYQDRAQALSDGEIDTRLSFTVLIGHKDGLLDPSDLYSGNEFLRRWYECKSSKNTDPKKATLRNWFDDDFNVVHKKLGPKVKVGPVDKIMATVFDEFFGLAKTELFNFPDESGVGKEIYKVINNVTKGDMAIEVLTEARRIVGRELDALYAKEVCPLVFFIGSSGLIPDDFGEIAAMTAEQLAQKYPDASLTKGMKEEGAFYDLGNGIVITVLTSPEYFTTDKGLEAIKKIEAA